MKQNTRFPFQCLALRNVRTATYISRFDFRTLIWLLERIRVKNILLIALNYVLRNRPLKVEGIVTFCADSYMWCHVLLKRNWYLQVLQSTFVWFVWVKSNRKLMNLQCTFNGCNKEAKYLPRSLPIIEFGLRVIKYYRSRNNLPSVTFMSIRSRVRHCPCSSRPVIIKVENILNAFTKK